MANKEIGELTAASLPVDGTELIHIVQGGNSRKATLGDLIPVVESVVNIQDEGSAILSADTINFTGAGVTVTDVSGVATITIPGGDGGGGGGGDMTGAEIVTAIDLELGSDDWQGGGGTGGGGGDAPIQYYGAHTHWRVRCLRWADGFNEYTGLTELIFDEPAVGGTILFSTQSSSSGDNSAAAAFDGVINTSSSQWLCQSGQMANAFIGYAYPSPVEIRELTIVGHDDTSRNMTAIAVDYSDNGTTWTNAIEFYGLGWQFSYEQKSFKIQKPLDSTGPRKFIADGFNRPTASDFPVEVVINAGTSSLSIDGEGNLVMSSTDNAENKRSLRLFAIDDFSRDFEYVIKEFIQFSQGNENFGLCLYSSVSGKYITFGPGSDSFDSDLKMKIILWNADGTFNSGPYIQQAGFTDYYLKVTKVKGQLIFSSSPDGFAWRIWATFSDTSLGRLTHLGISVNRVNRMKVQHLEYKML